MGRDQESPWWLATGVDGERGLRSARSLDPADVLERLQERPDPRDTAFDADGDDLAQVGWGVIVAEGEDSRILEALEPLVELRRRQAGELFRRVTYYGETPTRFRRNLGIAPGPVDPLRFPYHVLLIGGPEMLNSMGPM